MSQGFGRRPTTFGAIALHSKDIVDTDAASPLVVSVPAAQALLIGDFVFIDGNGRAAKSTTIANYDTRLGIVVGGKSTEYLVVDDIQRVGAAACAAVGDAVLVAIDGTFWAIADAAIAAPGVLVGIAAAISTAGRVAGAATTAGRRVGIALSTAAGAGSALRIAIIQG